ncbi:hypothetical protein BJX61DRAFT_552311 [Aspergillus egyptiacus]|nr:hypothetical protein BJX61DRAFT_552311 [Aspergillus egyptiacus]
MTNALGTGNRDNGIGRQQMTRIDSNWSAMARETVINAGTLYSAVIVCRSKSIVYRICTGPMAVRSCSSISAFPFLSPDEFEAACCVFLDRIQVAARHVAWSSIRLQSTGPILKISQSLSSLRNEKSIQSEETQGYRDARLASYEEDPEALIRNPDTHDILQVDYDVLLSPTYQVPVLYFVVRLAGKPLGIDEVYRVLVPDQYRRNIQSVGIMGGISFGYHPVSGTPALFVHPCNTAGAMRDIADGHGISPEAYLIIWLGLVGNCVRLQLPSELFATASMPELKCIE